MMPVIKQNYRHHVFSPDPDFQEKTMCFSILKVLKPNVRIRFSADNENKACREERECAQPRTEITRPARIMTMPTTLFKVQCSLRMNTPSSMPIGSPSWRNTWT